MGPRHVPTAPLEWLFVLGAPLALLSSAGFAESCCSDFVLAETQAARMFCGRFKPLQRIAAAATASPSLPPATLLAAACDRIQQLLQQGSGPAAPGLIDNTQLTTAQQRLLETLNAEFTEEYSGRAAVLLTRLDALIASFVWSGKGKVRLCILPDSEALSNSGLCVCRNVQTKSWRRWRRPGLRCLRVSHTRLPTHSP